MARTRKSQENKRRLYQAQRKLVAEVNKLRGEETTEDYSTEVSPQLIRLVGLQEYRSRDLAKINALLDSPELLQEHVSVINKSTGETVRGGEAIQRYQRYAKSALYHAPKESDTVVGNFITTTQDAFPDESTYHMFMNILKRLLEFDTSVGDNGYWEWLHPALCVTNKGKARSAEDIQNSKMYFMHEVADNVLDIQFAAISLTTSEGVSSLARRLQDAGEGVIDDLIIAGIGYKEQAGRAVQAVLKVLLPNDAKKRAMAMGEVPELVSDFNGEMDYED